MKFITYNISIFRFWFKYILLKTPIKIEAIEFLQKNYNATKREKKLIDKVKKINKMKLEEKNYTEQENNTYKVYAKHFAIVNFPYLTQEEFINKIKTDDDFAKKWGQIE